MMKQVRCQLLNRFRALAHERPVCLGSILIHLVMINARDCCPPGVLNVQL